MDTHNKLQETLSECERLKKENEFLKKKLLINESAPVDNKVTKYDSPENKIFLFMNLFKGRTDVYARRWISKDGRSGYAPVCSNEWDDLLCSKPKIKCHDCTNRAFLSLTKDVINKHLRGNTTIGVYPLQSDNTCRFLTIDFDKKHWKMDIQTVGEVCTQLNIPYYIERSRSGNGGHIWFFFSENISAKLARAFGSSLLNSAIEKRINIGLDSFDRMFPNQDRLPYGGFGNLIALPLQKEARNDGNSVFVDENFFPYPDPWLFLSSVTKLNKNDLTELLERLQNNKTFNKNTGNEALPSQIILEKKNGLHISKKGIPAHLLNQFIKLATLSNPEYYKAQANRYSTRLIPKFIDCSTVTDETIIIPRGCYDNVLKIAKENKINVKTIDSTNEGSAINVTFNASLRSQQKDALNSFINYDNGVLQADTGFGKTVTAAALIGENKTNTLIVVHRTQLLNQWKEQLLAFLQLSPDDIGQLGAGKHKPTYKIDIATIQSLIRKDQIKPEITQYGQIIVDECHHISAVSFEKVLKIIRARKVYGLTATPKRKDGLHPIIFMQCGPVRYKTNSKKQAKIRPFNHLLNVRYTKFKTKEVEIQKLYSLIAKNDARNELIFNDVLLALEEKRCPIVITERIEHVLELEKRFKKFVKNIIVLTGNKKKSERNKELERLLKVPESEERLIIATGKYIGEGFDDARLDTLFLTMPLSWKGTLQQYVGRLHRNHDNKSDVIVYDYVDKHVEILYKMYEKRLLGYKSMGYNELPNDGSEFQEQMSFF